MEEQDYWDNKYSILKFVEIFDDENEDLKHKTEIIDIQKDLEMPENKDENGNKKKEIALNKSIEDVNASDMSSNLSGNFFKQKIKKINNIFISEFY